MGSRGQFARSSVAHHYSGTTPTFDEATEGEAQSISRYTFEGPFSTIAQHEGPAHSPEEQSFIHSGGDRQCRVQPVGERLDSCLKFVERAQGRIERQKKIVEEAQQLLTKCESQLAAGLQDLEQLRAEARACPAPPASHTEPSIETTELRDLRREVEQLRRERNEWLAKPNSQFTEDVGDSRSSRMAGLIDAADAKRRCLEPMP